MEQATKGEFIKVGTKFTTEDKSKEKVPHTDSYALESCVYSFLHVLFPTRILGCSMQQGAHI